MVKHGNRDTGKDRLTTISAVLSDNRKTCLNILAERKGLSVGKVVQHALEQVYGKELDNIERIFLAMDLQSSEEFNAKGLSA